MVFSDTTNKQGIVEDITFLLGIDINGYPLADRTRNVNERFRVVWQMIFESYGGWRYMDDNVSDATSGVPYADQTLTSGTGLYSLPSGSLTIDSVQIKTSSGGTWNRLRPVSDEEFLRRGADGAFSSDGTPWGYMLQGDILRLLPTPNYTLASAMRIYFNQGISTFVATDTTKTPGFASPFHRMLSVGAALDYAIARGLGEKKAELKNLWDDYEARLKAFYSKRWRDVAPPRIGGRRDLMREFT